MTIETRTLTTENDREIRFFVSGQPDGIPVLVHHGTPGSHTLYESWVEDAAGRGMRLIGYDRPGYGSSTPHPGRSVADGAIDVAAIAADLGIERLGVWGISGGGPHALACAALLPDLVAAAASLASPAPYGAAGLDWPAGMGEDNIEEFGTAVEGRELLEPYIEAHAPDLINADAAGIVQALRSLLSEVDAAALTEEYAGFAIGNVTEGIEDSREGWVEDDLAFVKAWGFELSQIRIPVLLLHGEQDRFVPLAHGEWLAERIGPVQARFSSDDGHITLCTQRIPEVHAWLLENMA